MLTDEESAFGDYTLHERLGKGGMAETFVATRKSGFAQAPRVCLKRILPGLCDEPSLRAMFFQEAKLSAQLHHANVVRVVDFGEVSETAFLTLELVDGTDFRKLISMATRAGERLPDGVITEVGFALGCALHFAHAVSDEGVFHGLVHRDISPSNVLVATNGDVKLADFGIAKAVGQSVHTRTGTLKGKIPYMPPEYALHGRYDARSDLFALGVTLYEACAGRRPFQGANDVATLEQISSGRFTRLAERTDLRLPEALARAIDKLLAYEPKDRFPDAGAFVEAIADVAETSHARVLIAERARAARDAQRAKANAQKPKTESITERTEAIDAPAAEPLSDVIAAAPGDVTRTRAPRP